MSLIQRVTPVNLLSEREKFFSDNSYNPQFEYEEPADDDELYKYGTPSPEYLKLAENIVRNAYANASETQLRSTLGPPISQQEVEKRITDFLILHSLEKRYELVWSQTFISRTTISANTIKLRLPSDFRHQDLNGMLYHEIGTHALRQVNYEEQPWFKQKKQFGFRSYLKTEEGLATIHDLLPKSDVLAHSKALNYLATEAAQRYSFSELWEYLTPYIDNLDRRWTMVLRKKRGLTDTSQPGGFTKDLVYFEGFVDMLRWLREYSYDLRGLYYGKIAHEDVARARMHNPQFIPVLPSFYETDPAAYARRIDEIAQINGIA